MVHNMSAGDNLAHLNSLLGGIERPGRITTSARWDEEEYEEEEEFDSDDDYELADDAITVLFPPDSELSTEGIRDAWKEQRGTCAISGLCLDASSGGMYGAVVAKKHFSRPLNDANIIIVTRAIAGMRDAVDLPWTAFRAMLKLLSVAACAQQSG
jgi:hypothetical protein